MVSLPTAFTAAQKWASAVPTAFLRFDAETAATAMTEHVTSGPSTTAGAGNGLFARKDISAHDVIATVKGRRRSLLSCFFFVKDFSHVFTLSAGHLLVPDPDDVVQFANHHFDESGRNADLDRDPRTATITLVALRDIRRGEEIFVRYHDRHLKSQSWVGHQFPEAGTSCPSAPS
ncbi:SET domain-containing protein-lysine N-methyltransferase [Lentzea sp. NPDC058450]|uniref:SET domain-containing protein-lysine N-methyltransferase n=1 Tax=Lentzea sp. NPDC058450 TaxID=3346505 RepID=UPI003654C7A8